jgi:hypothetical protein
MNSANSGINHAVDGVDTAATDAYHFDNGQITAARRIHFGETSKWIEP